MPTEEGLTVAVERSHRIYIRRRPSSGRIRQVIAVVPIRVNQVTTHPVPGDMVLAIYPEELFSEIAVRHPAANPWAAETRTVRE